MTGGSSPGARLRAFAGCEVGAITVEFVATLPLYLAALVLAFEFGRGLWYHEIVTKGVRDATRYASRYPQLGCTTTAGFVDVVQAVALGSATSHAFWTDPETVAVSFTTVTSTDPATGAALFRTPTTCFLEVHAQVPVELATLAFFGVDTAVTIDVADRARYVGD